MASTPPLRVAARYASGRCMSPSGWETLLPDDLSVLD